MDVLVKTREEMERFGRVPAALEAEILERGKVIYRLLPSDVRPEE